MTTRLVAALAAAFAIAALAAACDGSGSSETPEPETTASPRPTVTAVASPTAEPQTDCSPNLTADLGDPMWEDILPDQIPAPAGWTVRDDPGGGPFLAVFEGEERVGSLELLQFPLEADFHPEEGHAALLSWQAAFFDDLRADRAAAFGDAYVFQPDGPAAVAFGGLCGLRYGFTGTMDGSTEERYANHATFDSENLYIINAFYDAATAEEGIGFKDEASLRAFESSLAELVAALRLP